MLTITPNVLGSINKSEAYTVTLVASGGTGPYAYALTAGVLPTGLAFDTSTGVISGTPTLTEDYSFTITATDSLLDTGVQPYEGSVTPPIYWYICTGATQNESLPTVTANQAEFNRQAAIAIANASKSTHQVGDLLARPILKSIYNHLLCDGSEVSRTAFPQLFAEIGTEWGEGDGTDTFNLPDLIGGAITVPLTAPVQTVTTGGTVSTPADPPVTQPTAPSQTGGTTGGNVNTGGVPLRPYYPIDTGIID